MSGFKCPAIGTWKCTTAGMENPNDGFSGFDNMGLAAWTILQVISLEGWSVLQYHSQDGSSGASWAFYHFILLLVDYFALQLLLAVMFIAFSMVREHQEALAKGTEALSKCNELLLWGAGRHSELRALRSWLLNMEKSECKVMCDGDANGSRSMGSWPANPIVSIQMATPSTRAKPPPTEDVGRRGSKESLDSLLTELALTPAETHEIPEIPEIPESSSAESQRIESILDPVYPTGSKSGSKLVSRRGSKDSKASKENFAEWLDSADAGVDDIDQLIKDASRSNSAMGEGAGNGTGTASSNPAPEAWVNSKESVGIPVETSPVLAIECVNGVKAWKDDMMRNGCCSCLWGTGCGSVLLDLWYSSDPLLDAESKEAYLDRSYMGPNCNPNPNPNPNPNWRNILIASWVGLCLLMPLNHQSISAS